MRKVSGELLHFADGIGQVAMAQHSVVSAHQIVALALSGLLIASRREKLLNLPEDPWIGGCRAPNHDRVAARLPHHPKRILRRDDIAVADHRDVAHRSLHFRDARPIGLAAVTLLARTRM